MSLFFYFIVKTPPPPSPRCTVCHGVVTETMAIKCACVHTQNLTVPADMAMQERVPQPSSSAAGNARQRAQDVGGRVGLLGAAGPACGVLQWQRSSQECHR